jgi:hypothetical protein
MNLVAAILPSLQSDRSDRSDSWTWPDLRKQLDRIASKGLFGGEIFSKVIESGPSLLRVPCGSSAIADQNTSPTCPRNRRRRRRSKAILSLLTTPSAECLWQINLRNDDRRETLDARLDEVAICGLLASPLFLYTSAEPNGVFSDRFESLLQFQIEMAQAYHNVDLVLLPRTLRPPREVGAVGVACMELYRR